MGWVFFSIGFFKVAVVVKGSGRVAIGWEAAAAVATASVVV